MTDLEQEPQCEHRSLNPDLIWWDPEDQEGTLQCEDCGCELGVKGIGGWSL